MVVVDPRNVRQLGCMSTCWLYLRVISWPCIHNNLHVNIGVANCNNIILTSGTRIYIPRDIKMMRDRFCGVSDSLIN